MKLSQKIAELRKSHNWSQEELAYRLGVTRQSVGKWESDAALPELDKVIIHELMPGIFSGLLMSFTYSLDDFIITYFTRGAKFQNLSIEIYSMTHRRISPKINALSALLFLAVLIVMVIINLRDRHEEKVQKKRT